MSPPGRNRGWDPAKSYLIRALGFLGLGGGIFWTVGLVLDAYVRARFITTALAVIAALIGCFILLQGIRMRGMLAVPMGRSWVSLVIRIVVGAVLSYPVMVLVTGLLFRVLAGWNIGIAAFTLWIPVWYVPFGAAVFASGPRRDIG